MCGGPFVGWDNQAAIPALSDGEKVQVSGTARVQHRGSDNRGRLPIVLSQRDVVVLDIANDEVPEKHQHECDVSARMQSVPTCHAAQLLCVLTCAASSCRT